MKTATTETATISRSHCRVGKITARIVPETTTNESNTIELHQEDFKKSIEDFIENKNTIL